MNAEQFKKLENSSFLNRDSSFLNSKSWNSSFLNCSAFILNLLNQSSYLLDSLRPSFCRSPRSPRRRKPQCSISKSLSSPLVFSRLSALWTFLSLLINSSIRTAFTSSSCRTFSVFSAAQKRKRHQTLQTRQTVIFKTPTKFATRLALMLRPPTAKFGSRQALIRCLHQSVASSMMDPQS